MAGDDGCARDAEVEGDAEPFVEGIGCFGVRVAAGLGAGVGLGAGIGFGGSARTAAGACGAA